MATHPDFPGASSRVSRGKLTWRYRAPGGRKQITLPGVPGDEDFALAYAEASRAKNAAEILNMPGRSLPFTFGKAARLLEGRDWWIAYDDKTQNYNAGFIERFLEMQVDPTAPLKWRDVPVEAITRDYLYDIVMSIYTITPHTGRHFLTAFRKLIRVAVEEKWIKPENDPCLSIKLAKPAHVGCKPWPAKVRAAFEARHPLGSSARTCYALAMWMGNRRSDIAHLSWDMLIEDEVEDDDGNIDYVQMFDFRQRKNRKKNGGKAMKLVVTAKLQAVLNALQRTGTILQRFDGQPYSEKALTNQMAVWVKQAGINEKGYTMHGLRRTFAHYLQEASVDLIEIRDMLGHDDVRTTQIYLSQIATAKTSAKVAGIINAREDKRDAAQRRANVRLVG